MKNSVKTKGTYETTGYYVKYEGYLIEVHKSGNKYYVNTYILSNKGLIDEKLDFGVNNGSIPVHHGNYTSYFVFIPPDR